MRLSLKVLLAVACALLFGHPVWAGGSGSTAFDFLNITIGARQIAMGGSGVAIADDLYATNINPAALGKLWREETSFLYTRWFQDVSLQYMGYAHPTLRWGTFAASLSRLGYEDIQGFDISGKRTTSLSARDLMGQFSYGWLAFDRIWAGATLKILQEKLHTNTATAIATDLGILYKPDLEGWPPSSSIGLSIRNIGTRPRFIEESADLPLTLQVGAAFRPFFEGLTLSTDLTKERAKNVTAQLGLEYLARGILAFRIGYNSTYDIGSGIGFGFGLRAWDLQFDYAFAGFSDLGNTHHFGLTFRFGSIAEAYYERGMKEMRQKEYARAIMEFGKVLSFDQRHRRALLRIREANELLQKEAEQLKQ